jgi:hypothetical protein
LHIGRRGDRAEGCGCGWGRAAAAGRRRRSRDSHRSSRRRVGSSHGHGNRPSDRSAAARGTCRSRSIVGRDHRSIRSVRNHACLRHIRSDGAHHGARAARARIASRHRAISHDRHLLVDGAKAGLRHVGHRRLRTAGGLRAASRRRYRRVIGGRRSAAEAAPQKLTSVGLRGGHRDQRQNDHRASRFSSEHASLPVEVVTQTSLDRR